MEKRGTYGGLCGNKGNRLYSVRDINQNVYNNDTEGDELSGRPYITKFPYLNYIDMLEISRYITACR